MSDSKGNSEQAVKPSAISDSTIILNIFLSDSVKESRLFGQ